MAAPEGSKSRLAIRFALMALVLGAVLFLPAGTLRFWQGWVFFAMFYGGALFIVFWLRRWDPALLERRLQTKEESAGQKHFRPLWTAVWLGALVLSGLDYRFAWSNDLLRPVPLPLTLLSLALLLAGYALVFLPLRANTFASATIRVETGQHVISDGPYRLIRHPMYAGILALILFTPLALGSWVALPVFLLLVPILVVRLVNEEKLLRRDLPGYSDYCVRTRFRMIPFVY
jgi:protein-S-isoprenylcysteine O-methyltransferase Ste14